MRRHAGPGSLVARLGFGVAVVGVLAFLTLPTLIVVLASFNPTPVLNFPPSGFSLRWYARLAARPDFWQGLVNTLVIAAGATALGLVIATGAAVVLQRRRIAGADLVTAALLSPLVVPGVLIGIGLLFVAVLADLVASPWILLVGHAVMVLPFGLRAIWTSLDELDPILERAAETLGARPARVLWSVVLPLARPGLLAAALFSAIMSINEFAVSLFLVGRRTQTLPVVLFNYTMAYVDPTIAAVSTVFVAGTLLVTLVIDRFIGLPRLLRLEQSR